MDKKYQPLFELKLKHRKPHQFDLNDRLTLNYLNSCIDVSSSEIWMKCLTEGSFTRHWRKFSTRTINNSDYFQYFVLILVYSKCLRLGGRLLHEKKTNYSVVLKYFHQIWQPIDKLKITRNKSVDEDGNACFKTR